MTTPDPTPDTELEVEELTDENLEEVSGGHQVNRL
jgi:bacteriocin-like protein